MAANANNPAAARAAIAEVQQTFQSLYDSDAPRRIIRPGIAAGLRVLRDAIRAAAPVNQRRVKASHRRFAKRARNMPAHAVANASLPNVTGRLRRSVGSRIRVRRGEVQGKAGLNVGKKPSKTPLSYAPHAHLITLGTQNRKHKSGKGVGRVRPRPFVRRAAGGAALQARQTAINEIKRQIDRHLEKGTKFTRKQGRVINLLYTV